MTTTTTVFSGEMINEKETLHGLNDRFAGFIEKVRHLERQNQLLESEVREMKERRRSPSSLEEEHGAGLAELRRLLRDVTQQKHHAEVEHQSLEEELARLETAYEREARGRADAEGGVAALKRDMGDACRATVQLDKKAKSLVDDVDCLKKSHEAEVSRMAAQVQEAAAQQQAHHHVDFGKADLTAALRDIRAQLQGHATSDLRQADEGIRAQFARLTEAAESTREALRAGQQEVQKVRRSLQARSTELDGNRGTRDALERQLGEVEDRHNDDILHYQDTIQELENKLISAKFDMSAHLREYQDLLNVKMELDVEILSYRKLLEGEETRLWRPSISGAPVVSMPYIYRQSPVHTLPGLGRPGGPGSRAEQPQYKSVEEIITREIERSAFEESSGSGESPDAGRAEEEEACDDEAERESQEEEAEVEDSRSDKHRESQEEEAEVEDSRSDKHRESQEEEAEVEDSQSDKHSADRNAEQASDSQQNQLESAGRSEQGDHDEVEEGISAMDKAEVECQAETTENNDRPTAESAHSEEVRSIEATGALENEPCDVAANVNGRMGSDAGMTSPTKAKAAGSKVEVKMTESEVDKKVGALKESEESDVKINVDTAQAKMLKDESSAKCPTDSRNVQVSSIVDKLQGEAPSLPTEMMETITDLTVVLSVTLPKDTLRPEKQNKETPSVVPKGEEKEDRITESMAACNKAHTVKSPIGHEVAKSTEKAADDADGEKEKSASVKSEPPKPEGEKSDSGDKSHTVEPRFPKETIAVTEDSKDTKQGLPDSSKTQESSNAIDESSDSKKDKHRAAKSDMAEPPKLDGEISISGDKTQTVEPVFPKIAGTEKSKVSQLDSSKTQESSNATDDASDLEKDKHTAAKSDMTEPPKGDGEKPNTGDNTQTVDATSPKEKIALTAETKDPQEGAPDSSKTQKPSNGKLEDEKSDSEDKTHTLEPIFPKEKITVTEESKDSSATQEQSNATDSEKDKHRAAKSDMPTQEPSITKDESSDLEKDKRAAAKSDMAEPPKGEGNVSVSEDTPQTVEPIFPKEKIAVSTEENKDTKQGLPDSSKTQEPSNATDDASDSEKDKHTVAKSDMPEPPKLDGEKSISEDKPQTVEPVFPKEKIVVTEKRKVSQLDSSQTQEPSNATDSEKDKHRAAKSDMPEPPKLEGDVSVSEDKPQTVEPIFPKEKIAVSTVENKDTKQGLADSSKTQESSNATDESSDLEKDKHTAAKSDMAEPPKLDGDISISGNTTQTVEPVFPKIVVTEKSKVSQPDSSKTQEPSNATDDASDLEKDKHTAAKSDMAEPPKGDGEKPNTGDNTQTVDATSPKEKIALTAETKDPQEGAPDSSKTQKPSNGKLEHEKSDSEDKTHTVEAMFPKETIAVTEESKDSSETQEQSNATDSEKDKHRAAKSDMPTQEPSIAKDESSDLEKDKRAAAKSDMAEPPKLDGEISISEDKTQTVEPVFPKIAVTEKSKVSQLDSSKTQEPSNAIDDASDLEKDKHTAAKSDMAEPPKGDGEKPNTGDNTQTVDATSPKEKIALTAETKDPQERAPDSSKTQKPSNGKLEHEKSDSEDKTHTVEPILPKEKIAVTEENKDSSQTQEQSNATDSEKDKHRAAKSDMPTQEPSIAKDESSDLEKDKRTAAKSDMAEPPKLDGEISISEDKTQTVEPIFPKDNIAVTEGNKDAKQPDGSKSQEPSKVPEKINNAKEKEEMLKDSAKNKDSGKTTENITKPMEISETKTTSQKEPGTSTVSLTAKTVDGLMSEVAKPKTENGFSNGIGGIKAEDYEPIKAVPQLGEAAKEKTNTSI